MTGVLTSAGDVCVVDDDVAAGAGESCETTSSESTYGGMLPDVDGGTHRALAVQEEREREGQVPLTVRRNGH